MESTTKIALWVLVSNDSEQDILCDKEGHPRVFVSREYAVDYNRGHEHEWEPKTIELDVQW